MNPILIFIIGTVIVGGLFIYKKKKGRFSIPNPFAKVVTTGGELSEPESEPEREPEREIYIMLKYDKKIIEGKNKQPPPLLWPEPFSSVSAIEAWRDSNPKLMEGVNEIGEAPRR